MHRTFNILFILLAFTLGARSQKLKLEPLFAAVVVKNIDSSMAWYSKVLGLELRNRVDNAGRGFKQAVLINKDIMIELVELTKFVSQDSLLRAQPVGTRILGYNKFGFAVKNIDALYQRFSAMQLKFYGTMVTDPVNKKKTFLLSDPDGNLVQFFEK
jgi:hypothetical protein